MAKKRTDDPFAESEGGDEGSGARGLTNPHDRFVRALLSNPERASALLRDHLPPEIVDRLADGPPVALEGSYISEELRLSQSDQLFEVQLRSGEPAFLYVLLEHKSYSDPALPLQLAGYQIRIWERYAEGRAERLRALPPILPVVLYHGRERWSAPASLYDMIAGDETLRAFAQGFGYHLRDLGRIDPDRLSDHAEVRAGLMALVYAFRGREAEGVLVEMLKALRDGSVLENQMVRYIYTVYDIRPDALTTAARKAKPERWEALVGSLADTLIKQGKAEGKAEGLAAGEALGREKGLLTGEARGVAKGKAEGKAEGLTRLLTRRFGPLPDPIATRIAEAELDQLDGWFDTAIDAPTLEAVFAADTSH